METDNSEFITHDDQPAAGADVAPPRPVALDYASSRESYPWTLRTFVAPLVILLLTAAYAVACGPSYWQSSWPPLDRWSQGWSWVWIPAGAVFMLLVPRSRLTLIWIITLAVATSAAHSWTYPFATMNPVFRWDWGMWAGNMLVALPIHLLLTGIVGCGCGGLMQGLEMQPLLFGEHACWRTRRLPMILLGGCLAAVPVIVFGYATWNGHHDAANGIAAADRDWAAHEPVIWSRDEQSLRPCGASSTIASCLDPVLNIPLRKSWYRRFEPGYNAEMHRLMALGQPAWFSKYPRIADQDMLRMQQSSTMKQITAYPCTLSANLVIIQGSATLPWGTSISTGNNDVVIASRREWPLDWDGFDTDHPMFVGHLPEYPGIIFLRGSVRGYNSVIACNDDGWLLEVLLDQRF